MRVLITGSAGQIGSTLVKGLGDRHEIRGLDRVPTPGLDDTIVGDVSDVKTVQKATEGMDAVIHLTTSGKEWDEALQNMFVGTYNVFEASRLSGVGRIAYASRAGILSSAYYPRATVKRTVDLYPRPESIYTISKVFAEGLGYIYWARHGIGTVGVRIGNFGLQRDQPTHPYELSHGDCVRLWEQAITHPGVEHEIVFGVSDSSWDLYDLEHGRNAIGYHPQDRSDVPPEKRGDPRPFKRGPLKEPMAKSPVGSRMRVLITGAAGNVGKILVRGMKGRHEVHGIDRVPMPELNGNGTVGDIADFDAVLKATRGMDAIIHLAGNQHEWEKCLNNVDGTYKLLEAARQNGVRRIAFASRAGLLPAAAYPRSIKRTIDMVPLPDSFYSLTKVFGESLGWMYHATYGMEFVSVRIGNCHPDRPFVDHPHRLSHRDAVRVFEQAVTYPWARFELVFGVSDSDWPLYDVDHGRRAIGYHPLDKSFVPESEREG